MLSSHKSLSCHSLDKTCSWLWSIRHFVADDHRRNVFPHCLNRQFVDLKIKREMIFTSHIELVDIVRTRHIDTLIHVGLRPTDNRIPEHRTLERVFKLQGELDIERE